MLTVGGYYLISTVQPLEQTRGLKRYSVPEVTLDPHVATLTSPDGLTLPKLQYPVEDVRQVACQVHVEPFHFCR